MLDQNSQQKASTFCYICEQKIVPSQSFQICCGKNVCENCLKQRELNIVCPKCNSQHDPQRIINITNKMRGEQNFFKKSNNFNNNNQFEQNNQKEIQVKMVQSLKQSQNLEQNSLEFKNSALKRNNPQQIQGSNQQNRMREEQEINRSQAKFKKVPNRQFFSQTTFKKIANKKQPFVFDQPFQDPNCEQTQHYNPSLAKIQQQSFSQQEAFFSQSLHPAAQSQDNMNNNGNFNNNNVFDQLNQSQNNQNIQNLRNNKLESNIQTQINYQEPLNNNQMNPSFQQQQIDQFQQPQVPFFQEGRSSQFMSNQNRTKNIDRFGATPYTPVQKQNNQLFYSVRQTKIRQDNFFINNTPQQSQQLASSKINIQQNDDILFKQTESPYVNQHCQQPIYNQQFFEQNQPLTTYQPFIQDSVIINTQPTPAISFSPFIFAAQPPAVFPEPIFYVVQDNFIQHQPPQFGTNLFQQISSNNQQNNQQINNTDLNQTSVTKPIYLNFNESKSTTPKKSIYDIYHDSISSKNLKEQESLMDLSSQNSTTQSSQYPKLNLDQNISFNQIRDWHQSNIKRNGDYLFKDSQRDSIYSNDDSSLFSQQSNQQSINFNSIDRQQQQLFESICNNLQRQRIQQQNSNEQSQELKNSENIYNDGNYQYFQNSEPFGSSINYQHQNQQQQTNQDYQSPNNNVNNQQLQINQLDQDFDFEQQFQNIHI
ncbi:hypothetical protein TTHERM_00125420 (macronuclear) [Tetrahymena thermophila SB210]|uniref:RING-type domain-containing protein n=1 Tax=Tetrahymena thermophila (strain SB210) TaxID=312017 RepID=I7LUS9_TETTS|nr:hypothetical protein TTHERM_00125420 [Tetrahymena thermophila SB210]EAR95976.2 hypothetical protein TTHERM_00125420 [Tetrahymena thermophila SB210]|eukprot:XP_001016221.2 hypothetical protein TTHERM_00125420 [Tetrahymena thermophila SB210]